MADAFLSMNEYISDGVKTQFELSFAGGYLSRDHVIAVVASGKDANGNLLNEVEQPFTWVSDYQISITPAIAAGKILRIYRNTPFEAPVVDFADSAIVTEETLDTNARQAVFLAAELRDRFGTVVDPALTAVYAAQAEQAVLDAEAAALEATSSVSGIRADLLANTGATRIGVSRPASGSLLLSVLTKGLIATPEEFGAVGDGVTDDSLALVAAFNSGRIINGGGRTYAVKGSLLINGNFLGMFNMRIKQTQADALTMTTSYRVLDIINRSGFTIRDVTIDMGSNAYTPFNDDAASGIYIGGNGSGSYCSGFHLDNVEVVGNGCGTGIHIRHARSFTVNNCKTHDRLAASSPDPTNDSQNGMEFFNCYDFQVTGCKVWDLYTRLSGVSYNKWTRGFLFVECREWVANACIASGVDQGYDISGGYDAVNNYIGNRNWTVSNCLAVRCGTYGFKCANVTRDGMLLNCTGIEVGFCAFVFSASSAILPTSPTDLTKYNTSNINVVACRAINSTGTSWAAPGVAVGFRIMSNTNYPSWPRGIRFRDCQVEDNRSTPIMTDSFASDAVPVTYPDTGYNTDIANYLVGCTVRGAPAPAGISRMYAFLSSSATQSLATTVWSQIDWNQDEDYCGLHNTTSNANAIYIKVTGRYLLSGLLRFASNANGRRKVRIKVNGVEVPYSDQELGGFGSADTTHTISRVLSLKEGDNVFIEAMQDSGGALTFRNSSSHLTLELLD